MLRRAVNQLATSAYGAAVSQSSTTSRTFMSSAAHATTRALGDVGMIRRDVAVSADAPANPSIMAIIDLSETALPAADGDSQHAHVFVCCPVTLS